MEYLSELLAPMLGVEPGAVVETLKDESKVNDLKSKLNGARILTPDQENSLIDNKLKSLTGDVVWKTVGEKTKAGIHNIVKGGVLEQKEKDLQETYGTAFERGKDYTTINELVDLIVTSKASKGNEDVELLKTKHQTEKRALLQSHQEAIEKASTDGEERVKKIISSHAISSVKSNLEGTEDQVKTKVAAIQSTYIQLGYKLTSSEDGEYITVDSNGETLVDKNHNPLPLSDVYAKISADLFGEKKVANSARGGNAAGNNGNGGQGSTGDFSKYSSVGQFMSDLSREGLVSGTAAFSARMKEFLEARPELNK